MAQGVAQPVGASVIAGQAQVQTLGANTVVNQNSAKAIINWQDFSVANGSSVQFNQPNSASITLNRVTGGTVSNIDGAIRANGQVWLLNPNGVLIGNNARINVGGLLATTSDIANQDFQEGRYNFSGGGNGAIVNNGKIRAKTGGSVVLSAPNVANNGLVSANAGHVVLGGTDTFTVDFHGDRLISYAVGPSGQTSGQTGTVTNSGTIKAAGGQVLMTARAAAGVQSGVINNSGMVQATSARSVNGEIILDAGEGSAVNSGTLNATGAAAGETGGTVKILGRVASVSDNAGIDVSGSAGGGTILIGGNYQGSGTERHSQNTIVGKASINADAIISGNGGLVAVWSDGRTDFAGTATARGGARGGNGGQVETSGHDLNIAGSGFVSTLAPLGKAGNWLLDPHNINIVTGGNDPETGQSFNNSPQVDANIDPAAIASGLTRGNITLQAATDIIFQNTLTVIGAAGNTLTLQAGRTIDLGLANLSYASGNVVMIANDPGGAPTGFRDAGGAFIKTSGGIITASQLDLILNSDGISNGTIGSATNPIVVGNATNVYLKTLNADTWLSSSGTLQIGNSSHSNGLEIGTGTANLTGASISQSGAIFASALNASATGANGIIGLGTSGNVVSTIKLNANGNINFYNSGNLSITSIAGYSNTGAQGLNLQAAGTITLGDGRQSVVIATSGTTVLHASGSIIQNGGTGVSALAVGLTSDNGTLGTSAAPLALATGGLATRTLSRDQFFNVTSFNGGTTLNFSNISTSAAGQIGATSTTGVNAGSGNVRLLAGSALAVNSVTNNGNTFSVTAGNFAVTGSAINIFGATVQSFSATAGGNVTFGNTGSFQIRDTTGLKGINASALTLTANNGSITQASGAAGAINAASLNASISSTSGNIILSNGLNTVPVVNLNAPGTIVFFNSVSTLLNRAGYSPGTSNALFAAQALDVEVLGAGHTLTIGAASPQSGNLSIYANFANLHANGDIIQSGPGGITANGLALVSDNGSIGATGAGPILRGVGNLAARAAGNIVLNSSLQIVNGVAVNSTLSIGSVSNPGPLGGSTDGITAGGSIGLFLGAFDVVGSSPITGKTLAISGNSILLDNVNVGSLTARSQSGTIDITTNGNLVINNTLFGGSNSFAGIQTTGEVNLNADNGTVTQVGGTAGAILAGNFSVFGNNGVTLDNPANSISGLVRMGSLGNALLVNALATRLELGAAAGSFTVISGGDLELVAGPSIGSLISSNGIDVSGVDISTMLSLTQSTGTIVSLKTGGDGIILSTPGKFINNFGATALYLPNGARFLVYSADPATDKFNGLKTINGGIFGVSYPAAVTAPGNRYIFSVASSGNADYQSANGLSQGSSTAAAPELVGFVQGVQPPRTPPPPPPPARADILQVLGLPPLPPPPPPPPPRNTPLADLAGPGSDNGQPPSSSDQATAYVASSLEGSPPPVVGGSSGGGGGTIIPRYLTAQPNIPPGTLQDPSLLPAFGNTSLWQ